MRTWPTAADLAQRCLSEFFAQVRLETERLSAGGTASRRPACAGCTRCARACAATGQRVGAAPSREVRHVRRSGVRSLRCALQGDTEKRLGLPVSPMCDRETTQLAQSQVWV